MVKRTSERLGAQIRAARQAARLSQGAAAEGICSVSHLSLIESGRRIPSFEIEQALRLRLGMDPQTAREPSEDFQAIELALRLGNLDAADERLAALTSGNSPAAQFYRARVADLRGHENAADAYAVALRATGQPDDLKIRAATALCRILRDRGDLTEAVAVGEQAVAEFSTAGPGLDPLVVDLHGTLAGAYCETGDLVRARQLTRLVEERATGEIRSRASLLWAEAMVSYSGGRFVEAARATSQALSLLEALDMPLVRADLQQTSVWLALRTEELVDPGLHPLVVNAELMIRSVGTPMQLAMCLSTRAELEARLGHPAAAEKALLEALELLAEDNHGVRARIMAAAAETMFHINKAEQARAYLLEARATLEASGAQRSAAIVWRQLAAVHEGLGDVDLAYACLKAATDLLGLGAHAPAKRHAPQMNT